MRHQRAHSVCGAAAAFASTAAINAATAAAEPITDLPTLFTRGRPAVTVRRHRRRYYHRAIKRSLPCRLQLAIACLRSVNPNSRATDGRRLTSAPRPPAAATAQGSAA